MTWGEGHGVAGTVYDNSVEKSREKFIEPLAYFRESLIFCPVESMNLRHCAG